MGFLLDCQNVLLVPVLFERGNIFLTSFISMITIFGFTFGKLPSLASFDLSLGRERLIQNGRIIVIDDEEPLIIEELRRVGFAVDHDKSGDDLTKLDNQLYDVAIVDFHGVGKRLGTNQGLDLLKHVRRVSPRTRLIAYTSRSLSAVESEFFRLSHVVMPKDMGLGDSLTLIEEQLTLAFTKEHLFESLVNKLGASEPEQKQMLQEAMVIALTKKNASTLNAFIVKAFGIAAEKSVKFILDRIFG